MFGGRREVEQLRELVGRLEREIEELRGREGAAQRLLDDTGRLEMLANRAAQLSAATEATLAAVQAMASESGVRRPRLVPEWNVVYRSDSLGLVTAWMHSGWNDRIHLRVGPDDPPTESICYGNSKNDLNSFVCGVVRPGECWMLESEAGAKTGWDAMYTPLS